MDKGIISEALGRLRKEMRGRTGKKLVSGPSVTVSIEHKPEAGGAEEPPPADQAEKPDKGAPDVSDIVAKALRGGKK